MDLINLDKNISKNHGVESSPSDSGTNKHNEPKLTFELEAKKVTQFFS